MFARPNRHRLQGLCLAVLASLVLAPWTPAAAQVAPPPGPPMQQGPEVDAQTQALASRCNLDPQLVAAMLEAGIPPEDIGPELAAEWPAHLQRLAEREARRQPRPSAPGVITPELEIPPDLAAQPESAPSGGDPNEAQQLWRAIEAAHAAGDTQGMVDLATRLPQSEWIAAARLLQEIMPPADRPVVEPVGPIALQDEVRDAEEAASQRAALEQAETASRAAALAPDLEPEKLATPGRAQKGQHGEATLTVGDSCTYATLQAAVDAAASGDTIRVQGRTYTGTAGTVNINAKSLTISGGYNSTCTVQGTAKTVTGHTSATFGVMDTTSLDGDALIVWGNDGGALVAGTGAATLDCSVLQATYAGTNNVVADPQFMNAAGGDYHVVRSSPAVDHCTSGFLRDIDYELRPIDVPGVGPGTYDAGADEANAFVGLNGATCTHPTIVSAITAAANGDTIYISPGVYPERLGTVTKDLTFVAATADCTAEAPGGATIDANDAAASWGGVAEIGTSRTVTFRNLTLTDGTAQYGGILYANSGAHVVLANTDLTYGTATSFGGALRLILGSTVELIDGSRIVQSTTTGGDGGGAANYQATLILRDDSRIGDYLQGNTSAGRGGGIFMEGGSLQMWDTSRVRSNVAATNGGGVYASAGAGVELHNSADIGWTSTTSNNDAVDGGGIYLTGGGTTLSLSDDSGVQNNYASNYGGGIYATGGASASIDSALVNANEAAVRAGGLVVDGTATVTVQNGSTVNDNLSNDLGGGIYLQDDGGTLTIDASHVDNNTANGWFGGIRVFGNGTLTLRNGAAVSDNDALGDSGGGLGLYIGTINIDDAAIQSNTAVGNGGGIYIDTGMLNAVDPDIRYNYASNNGGGIYRLGGDLSLSAATKQSSVGVNSASSGSGGGIYDTSGGTLIVRATNDYVLEINTNRAGANGGGIYADDGTTIDGWGWVQFTSNVAGSNGGALYLTGAATAWLDDTSTHGFEVWVNTATNGNGGGIYAAGSPMVELDGAEIGAGSNGNQAPNGDGGGIYLDDSTLNADNTLFRHNQAGDDGGGVAATNTSAVTIFSSMAPPTQAEDEEGESRPELATPCDPSGLPANAYCSAFYDNSAGDHGGGLHFEGESTGTIAHTALMANTAQTGSALELYDSTVSLRHSRVSGNTATGINNSTVHVYDVGGAGPTSTFSALHNTFAGNTFSAVYYALGTSGAFDNNIIWGNGHPGQVTPYATATCNDTQGGALAGAGNISLDPDFIATVRGEYHLAPGSPALDTCAAGSSPDLDDVARPKGIRYDMGAFELWCAGGITDVDGSGKVDIKDIQRVAGDWNDPGFLPQYDMDCDGDVDVIDLIAVAGDWEA